MSETKPPPPAAPESEAQARMAVARLALLLQLQRRALRAEREELPFVLVNETRQLLEYRQAVFWRVRRGGRLKTETLSGLAVLDKSAPFVRWLDRLAAREGRQPDPAKPRRLDPDSPPGPPPPPAEAAPTAAPTAASGKAVEAVEAVEAAPPPAAPKPAASARPADWAEWLPPHGLWFPLVAKGRRHGVLAFFRDKPFHDQEIELIAYLADVYAQALALGTAKFRHAAPSRRWLWIAGIALAAAGLCWPVTPSALAPGEVAPRRPEIVRAAHDGVIDRFHVEPNQRVAKGMPLVSLDDTQLRTRLVVARKAEEMAAAEYRQLQQSAFADPRAKALLALTRGKMEQLAVERAYVESLLSRSVVGSATDGVALFDRPEDWLGRPVSLGQKIMMVADPGEVELEINLPIAEALELAVGDPALFFPNIAPGDPLEARLTYIGHRAQETPGVGAAFRLRAAFPDGAKPPLLGLRGTVKLQGGDPRPLALVILRRPIAAVRQWLGW